MHYISHLSKDVVLKKLIDEQEKFELEIQKNLCIYLCLSIMSQQLSTKVAEVFKKTRLIKVKTEIPGQRKKCTTIFVDSMKGQCKPAKRKTLQRYCR